MAASEQRYGQMRGGKEPPEPLTQEDIVRQLDAAILEHLDWMLRWNRSAVCKVQPAGDITSEHAHFLCGFGNWYDLHQHDPLVAQPAFEALALAHRDLHRNAAWLAARAWKDAKIPVEEYDVLVEKVTRFTDLARKLLKAFQKVASDLDQAALFYHRHPAPVKSIDQFAELTDLTPGIGIQRVLAGR